MLGTWCLQLMYTTVLALLALPAIAADPVGGGNGSFLFPDSDRRLIRERELLDADERTLWQTRNEIFARKGYRFSNPGARQFFEGQHYYTPTQDQVQLNPIEAENIATIRRFEGYLRNYPERAFEATYEVEDGSTKLDKGVAVRECPAENCRILGQLRPGCAVNSDVRMDRPDWAYVRSSSCGDTPGPFDGYVLKAVLSLVAG